MKISKQFNDIVYFLFPCINGVKKLLNFLHFKLMIALVVTCLTIKNFLKGIMYVCIYVCIYYIYIYLYVS